jgi:hypothetical protein
MTLTTAQQVRLLVQDVPTLADATYYGDGLLSTFPLPHRNLTSASAFVPIATGWSATGATFNVTGSVAFAGTLSAASAFRTTYVYSTFSDEEIGTWLTAGGGVNGAGILAVQTLMFDSLKRASWRAPDGTQFDDRIALSDLKALYDTLKEEEAEQAIGQGGISEWGLRQQDF